MLKSVVLFAASFLACTVSFAQQPTAASEIPVQTLFRKPAYSGLVLSPNQRYLAALAPINGRRNVVVVDLQSRSASMLTSYEVRDVNTIFWANDDRLLYTTGDQQGLEFRGDGGLFAVDRDGKNPKVLVEPLVSANGVRFIYRTTTVIGRLRGNSDEVLVSANDRSVNSQDVYRMNSVTGRKTLVTVRTPGRVARWVLDSENKPLAALSIDLERKRWWCSVRTESGDGWRTAAEWDESLQGAMIPLAADPTDSMRMYVATNVGRDTMAIRFLDIASAKLGDLVYADDRFDVSSFYLLGDSLGEGGRLLFGGPTEEPNKLIGVRYNADRPKTVWFDREAAEIQAAVDSALPATVNQFNVNQSRTIVLASSDVDPGGYYIFDRKARTLEDTGLQSRPWIRTEQMAPMRPVRWTARDGMPIDGYLTLPLGYKPGEPVPLVLHPHGGPWAKDNWGFNPEVQFMANRGYAVLQPNFRGSTGYGAQHLRSSYRQWGGTMIDDMIDGVEWAIKQGFADPARVGVYGASYGGYATLMAMEKKPELFNWGVNYVGVTDMALHQDTQPAQRYGNFGPLAKILTGDQNADRALFEEQSPARHVARIAAPVFSAYGGEDRNVDVSNGYAIKDALNKSGKSSEWMLVVDEAHGFRADKNVFEFYSRFDKFMKANTLRRDTNGATTRPTTQ